MRASVARLTAPDPTLHPIQFTQRMGLAAAQGRLLAMIGERSGADRRQPRTHPPGTEPAPDWRWSGVCTRHAPEMFFPTDTTDLTDAAKEVCWTCPVLAQCRACAADHGIVHGVWGGLSETELQNLAATPAASS